MSILSQSPNISFLFTGPTHGELIDLFAEVEKTSPSDGVLLSSKLHELYPNIPIGRPARFYDTVQRIVGPIRPSLRGEAKLCGSPLASYRRRVREPRLRNSAALGMHRRFVSIDILP